MYQIQQITDDPFQQQTLVLYTGSSMTLQLYYRPIQQGWYINSLTYLDFTLNGIRISNQINMLRQWRNIIPFGLACISTGDREPSFLGDFATGASILYILSADEVAAYETYLNQ